MEEGQLDELIMKLQAGGVVDGMDPNVVRAARVIMNDATKIAERAAVKSIDAIKEYGTDTTRTDYTPLDWIDQLEREQVDSLVYYSALRMCVTGLRLRLAAYEKLWKKLKKLSKYPEDRRPAFAHLVAAWIEKHLVVPEQPAKSGSDVIFEVFSEVFGGRPRTEAAMVPRSEDAQYRPPVMAWNGDSRRSAIEGTLLYVGAAAPKFLVLYDDVVEHTSGKEVGVERVDYFEYALLAWQPIDRFLKEDMPVESA